MAELQWNLLDTTMPAQIANSFTEGQKNQLAMSGDRQNQQLNALKMQAATQEMADAATTRNALAPYGGKGALEVAKMMDDLKSSKIKREAEVFSLQQKYASDVANNPTPENAYRNYDAFTSTIGATPEQYQAGKAELDSVIAKGPLELHKWALGHSLSAEEKLKLIASQDDREQRQENFLATAADRKAYQTDSLQARREAQEQSAALRRELAGSREEKPVPVVIKDGSGRERVVMTAPGKLGTVQDMAQVGLAGDTGEGQVTQVGTTKLSQTGGRNYVAEAGANGFDTTKLRTKPMQDAFNAAGKYAEEHGLVFDPQKALQESARVTSLGRTSGSRIPTARAINVESSQSLLDDMEVTNKKLDFSNVDFAAKLDAWKKGQLQDPTFKELLTQRADLLFKLSAALKENGVTDKALTVEEATTAAQDSTAANAAWINTQRRALNQVGEGLNKTYGYNVRLVPTAEPGTEGKGPKALPVSANQIIVKNPTTGASEIWDTVTGQKVK